MKKALAIASALFLGAALASPAAHAQWSGIEGKQGGDSRERGGDEGREDPRGRDDGRRDGRQGDASGQAAQAYGGNSPYDRARGEQRGGNAQYGSQGGRNDNPYGGSNDHRDGSGHERSGNRYGNGNTYGNGYGNGQGHDNNRWDDNRHGGHHDNQWDNNRHGGHNSNHWDNNRYGGRNDHRYSRYYSPHRYRSSFAYVQPYGYRYSRWDVGAYLPHGYFGRSYYVDYRPYGLAPPPRGFQWVRVDRDVYLVSIYDGRVRDILHDLFY